MFDFISRWSVRATVAMLGSLAWPSPAHAQPTPQSAEFTYQGVLKQSGALVNGSVDLRFELFDAAIAGNAVGAPEIIAPIAVVQGLFTTSLDFGTISFNGEERWLEIGVSAPNTGLGPFTTLTPRQKLTTAPYAAFALQTALSGIYADAVDFNNAGNAFSGNGGGLTGLNASNLSSGTIAAARLSGNYSIGITGNAATATVAGNISGIAAIANGGTGASNAVAARTNLGAAAATHSHVFGDVTGSLAATQLPTGGAWSLASSLNVDASTFVIDQLNNRVGIGLPTPSADLHIRGPGGLGWLLITPTTAGTLSQITLSENASNTFGMIVRMDGAANQLNFLANNAGVEQTPVLSIARSASPAIGVGTTAPETPLHVMEGSAGAITAVSSASLALERDSHNYLNLLAPDAGESGVLFGNPTNGAAAGGVLFNSAGNANGLQFRTGGNNTRAVIDANGNMGVGTTVPTDKLHVAGNTRIDGASTGQAGGGLDVHLTAGQSVGTAPGGSNGGDILLDAGVGASNHNGGRLTFNAGAGGDGDGGDVFLNAGDTVDGIGGDVHITAGTSTNVFGGDIVLMPGNLGVIFEGGVGLGRNPVNQMLEVEGNATKTTAGNWLANSDSRIKTEVETVTNALDTLAQVRLASFRYTPQYLKAHPSIEDRRYLNVIAQEFAQVFPEHVKGSGEFLPDGSEILQVDIHPLTIYSAGAIQELHARMREKDIEIAHLRCDVESLRNLVRQLLEK